jgi:hypothetical protein
MANPTSHKKHLRTRRSCLLEPEVQTALLAFAVRKSGQRPMNASITAAAWAFPHFMCPPRNPHALAAVPWLNLRDHTRILPVGLRRAGAWPILVFEGFPTPACPQVPRSTEVDRCVPRYGTVSPIQIPNAHVPRRLHISLSFAPTPKEFS